MTAHSERYPGMIDLNTQRGSVLLQDSEATVRGWTAELITNRPELENYSSEWNELLEDSPSNTIFLTWEWVSSWLDAVYPEAPLFVVIVRAPNGLVIAIAPFYLSELRLLNLVNYRCLRVIGDCYCGSEYPDVIVRNGYQSEALAMVSRCLLAHSRQWDCAWIPRLADWTGAMERLGDDLGARIGFVHKRPRVFASIELPDSYQDYLDSLSKSTRSNVGRQEKKLLANHEVKVLRCKRPEELSDYLDALFTLHQNRWGSVGQAGSFVSRPELERFYRRFAPEALTKGWLRIFLLQVDGIVRAVQYGYVYRETFHQLQEGFDTESVRGTGNVLRLRVIEACIRENLREYDFLGGFTGHKRHWRARQRWGGDVFIGRKSMKTRLLACREIWPTGRYLREGRPIN